AFSFVPVIASGSGDVETTVTAAGAAFMGRGLTTFEGTTGSGSGSGSGSGGGCGGGTCSSHPFRYRACPSSSQFWPGNSCTCFPPEPFVESRVTCGSSNQYSNGGMMSRG